MSAVSRILFSVEKEADVYLLPRLFVTCTIVLAFCSCSATGSKTSDKDAPDLTGQVDVPADDAVGDLAASDLMDNRADLLLDVPVKPTARLVTFKAIGGASMGANGLRIHALHPEKFDLSAALGGYVNPAYLHDMLKRQMFGGFCDLETLEANIDKLNDPDAPELQCGPTRKISPWEFDMDFNHFKADFSGGLFHRSFVFMALESLFMTRGNLLTYNPEHPLLPPGVPVTWLAPGKGADNCAAPVTIGKPLNYSADYNPEGKYNLVTFCDGTPPIEGGKDNPEYFNLAGNHDPDYPYDKPVSIVTAVDLNGNGKRDFHEPVVINSMERFKDVGIDGCDDPEEDGNGGCTGGGTGDDPNGDNIHIPDNPLGTQGDGFWQEGEDYEDFGLDGVDGTGDSGEKDGQFSMNPHLKEAIEASPSHFFKHASGEQLDRLTFLFDGGIRDSIHAAVGTWPMPAILADRGENVGFHDNYTGEPQALHPTAKPVDFTSAAADLDLSQEAVGRHYMVLYGHADATPEEIAFGDGKHVGNDVQVINRLAGFILTALFRWPDMDWTPCTGAFGKAGSSSFYSPALQNRVFYSHSLPPCYTSEEFAETDFPLLIFMPGQGTGADASTGAAIIFNMLSMAGTIPKFIMLAPEGDCCLLRPSENGRYCACRNNDDDGSLWDCLDPDCTGEHESCQVISIPKNEMTEECNGGHFFSDHASDRFGDLENAKLMKYETMLLELVDHFEGQFRVRKPKVYTTN